MKSFHCEPENVILGSVLRRALAYLLSERELRYDPQRLGSLNDLVFGEMTGTAPVSCHSSRPNWLERLYPSDTEGSVRLTCERLQPGPCVAVVANRYAPPYLIGGLTDPITGQPNGEVRGGVELDALFGVNVIGYINRGASPDGSARIKVRGVVVDRQGRPLNLSSFRDVLAVQSEPATPRPRLIVVAGRSTDAGKTTCMQALVTALRCHGFTVTVEKKTGTACCRDWLRCHADPRIGALENVGDEFVFALDALPARDFVDAVGVASDVSASVKRFVPPSVAYTRAFLSRNPSDFHVIELADSISHFSNVGLLRSQYFREHITTLVYAGVSTHESAAHLVAYWRSLGYGRTPIVLSGPLANEEQYAMARDEIRQRLDLEICRSATQENNRWIPTGSELARAIQRRLV
jgi:hypothetical protein